MKKYKFNITKPGGNNTCLILDMVKNPSEKKKINDFVMKLYPIVEQVGFLKRNNLEMAGGEFCGNAIRSAASILLKNKPGEIKIKVSGSKKYLKTGIKENGEIYAQMPIFRNTNKIKLIKPLEFLVEMEGISQLINFNYQQIKNLSPKQIKKKVKNRINELNLDRFPAAGIIYVKQKNNQYSITPIVYVRDLNTLFIETACGSATMALGLVLAKNKASSIKETPILQPSGMLIKVSVDYNGRFFKNAFINGPIKTIASGEFKL